MKGKTSKERKRSQWFLKRYAEFKYLEIPKGAFIYGNRRVEDGKISVATCAVFMEDEKRCYRLAENIWNDHKPDIVRNLIEIMDETLSILGMKMGERYAMVLKLSYFNKSSIFTCTKETCEALDICLSRYYVLKGEAEDEYINILRQCGRSRGMDMDKLYDRLRPVVAQHEPGGILYRDSIDVLKRYRKVKYDSVRRKLRESSLRNMEYYGGEDGVHDYREILDRAGYLADKDVLSSWMRTSLMENTYAELIIVDEAISQMRKLGEEGRSYAGILTVAFTDERYEGLTMDKKIEKLRLTQRVFYERRKQALSMFSKILWGTSGYRSRIYKELQLNE